MNRLWLLCLIACGARTGLSSPDLGTDAGRDASMPIGCIPGTFALQRAEPTVMFVLDRSGSMGMRFSGNATRWQVLSSALASSLPPVDPKMRIGALLFPSNPAGPMSLTCTVSNNVALMPDLGHVNPLLSIVSSTIPGGSTPTADAIDVAAKALFGARAATTSRALVLATDGAPNCNAALDPNTCTCTNGRCRTSVQCLDDTRTVARIASYAQRGLPTYVIGIQSPGDTQNNTVLDAMADAGGRANKGAHHFYAATSAAELDAALVAIRDQIGACTYLTISVPPKEGTIVVSIDGMTIPFDANGASGWHWANKENGEIVFAGTTCTDLTNGAHGLAVTVTCDVADASSDAHDGSTDALDAADSD